MKRILLRVADQCRRDQSGATAIEYGLLVAVIAITLITGLHHLGESANQLLAGIERTTDANDPIMTGTVDGTGRFAGRCDLETSETSHLLRGHAKFAC